MVFISSFTNTRNLADIKRSFDNYAGTNINFLLDSFRTGSTTWSVPKKAFPGDIILFMCAKEARHNLGMATSHIPDDYSDEFRSFVKAQKTLYKKYSGTILGYGVISSLPEEDEDYGQMAESNQLTELPTPIRIEDFRSFITVSSYGSITYLSNEQWERLRWTINQYNPELFSDAKAPEAIVLEREFNEAVRKAGEKSLEQLKKVAEKNASQPSASSVKTNVYHRDPFIAAYVKKRANGHCQLCGMKAPFLDEKGDPYLECHHIEWLSKGGKDSPDNCVALCPNCHRKMHICNDPEDLKILRSILVSAI